MDEVKKIVNKEEVVTETYLISGRVLDLLKNYAATVFIGKNKYKIIKLIIENKEETTVDQISKKFRMSKPLVAYHMNGNYKSEGMIKSDLVTSREIKGKTHYKKTDFGRFIFEFAKVKDIIGRKK